MKNRAIPSAELMRPVTANSGSQRLCSVLSAFAEAQHSALFPAPAHLRNRRLVSPHLWNLLPASKPAQTLHKAGGRNKRQPTPRHLPTGRAAPKRREAARTSARKNRERPRDVGGGAASGAGRAEAARGPRQAPPRPVPPRQRDPQR